MRKPSAALILVTSLLIAVPAIAGQFEDASKAYQRGDYKTANRLLKPLAEQGSPKSQYNLGLMYALGQGVRQDYVEAVKWYRKAADQGDAAARYNLGLMYALGQGVAQDHAIAAMWYRKAADQGDASAQFNLGLMYGMGQGVPQDYVQSYMWFTLAASQFTASEQGKREMAGSNRDISASKMTPAQIAEAQRLVREWKPKKEK